MALGFRLTILKLDGLKVTSREHFGLQDKKQITYTAFCCITEEPMCQEEEESFAVQPPSCPANL